MTTFLLLSLGDDGGYAEAYEYDRSELLNFRDKRPLPPTLLISDSTAATYHVDGWVINLRRTETDNA